jgi:hypothetical protein
MENRIRVVPLLDQRRTSETDAPQIALTRIAKSMCATPVGAMVTKSRVTLSKPADDASRLQL